MTTLTITTFALLVSLSLFVIGYLLKESRKKSLQSGFLMLSSFVLLLVVSVILLANPISYPTGETVTTNYIYVNSTLINTSELISYSYTPQSESLNTTIATILMLVGLFGTLEISRRMYQERTDRDGEIIDYE